MFNEVIAKEMIRLLPPTLDRELVPPPWDELALPGGYAFPRDYRWFIETYGYGAVNDYLHILSLTPWSPRGGEVDALQNFLYWSQSIDSCGPEHNGPGACDINWQGKLLSFAADDPGGLLLCWGKGDGGNLYYWARETGDPDTWPVMVHAHNSGAWFRLEGGFIECLLAVMRETFPRPGEPINPEEEWEYARAQPVWECEGDWSGPVAWP